MRDRSNGRESHPGEKTTGRSFRFPRSVWLKVRMAAAIRDMEIGDWTILSLEDEAEADMLAAGLTRDQIDAIARGEEGCR